MGSDHKLLWFRYVSPCMYLQDGEILSLLSTVKSSEPRRVPGTWNSARYVESISNHLLTFMGEETQGHPESNNDTFVKVPEVFRQLFYLFYFCRHVYFTRALPSISVIIKHNYTHTHTHTHIFTIVSYFYFNFILSNYI